MTFEEVTSSRLRRRLARPTRGLALSAMLLLVVAWAFAQGAHEHGALAAIDPTLADAVVDERYVIDASTGSLDLAGLSAAPGSVVEFLLDGSAGAPHQFLLNGGAGAQVYTTTAPDGDTILRMRIPEQGNVAFFCAIPGHEGLHGSLVVDLEG